MFHPTSILLTEDGPHAVLTPLRCGDKWFVGVTQLQQWRTAQQGLQLLKILLLLVLPSPGGSLLQQLVQGEGDGSKMFDEFPVAR